MTEDSVVWLEEVGKEDIANVGGKGASLGEMLLTELPVQSGFTVTEQAFQKLDRKRIYDELFGSLDDDNAETLKNAEEKAKKIVMDAKISSDLENNIMPKYPQMRKNENLRVFVAVRSSATSIHLDIWARTCLFTINLFKHTVLLFLTILIIWLTIKFTELLFPNLPFAVIILLYISEVALIILFVRESMDDS